MEPTHFTSYILAAGNGKRMQSDIAKPLHKIGGKAMLGWVIDTARRAGSDQLAIITSPHHEQIEHYLEQHYQGLQAVKQNKPLGTGHAAQTALQAIGTHNQPVLVLFGDTPLITAETCQRLVSAITDGADICVLGFEADDPTGYGRLKIDETGALCAIIEEADATQADKDITIVNAGVMALSAHVADSYLQRIQNDNAQGEYYLTDLVSLGAEAGLSIAYQLAQEAEVQGVNSRADLALVEASLQTRLRDAAMMMGVTLIAPETVFLSADTHFGRDVIIDPHVVIASDVSIAEGAHIKSFCHLEGAMVGAKSIIGPYARLRPGTKLGQKVKIGNFVETKKSIFDDGAKANHLSYVGDANVGAAANIGAGTITCNYDGYDKFQTTIGKGAFIGSNTALVAPITIGDGAIIGAGSTITKNVETDDLAITRAPQKQLPKGGAKFRARKGK